MDNKHSQISVGEKNGAAVWRITFKYLNIRVVLTCQIGILSPYRETRDTFIFFRRLPAFPNNFTEMVLWDQRNVIGLNRFYFIWARYI